MSIKIYTKTGDKGQTALVGGTRTSKASERVEAYGTIDELNSFIGVAKSFIEDEGCIKQLAEVQYQLFNLGSEASTPVDKLFLHSGKPRLPETIQEENITQLEVWIDEMDQHVEPLKFFILPGGGKAATFLHVARTVCRRAERLMVGLREREEIRDELIKYLNRLSDYLFMMARYVSQLQGEPEEYWNPSHRKTPNQK